MEYIFETERLRTRKFVPEDAFVLYKNHLGENIRKWIPNESYADIAEAKSAVNFYIDCVDNNRLPCVLAVELKDTGDMIGDVGINEVDGRSGEIEIGYVIGEAHCGQGYATELVKAMTEYIFSAFDAAAVYGRVLCGNQASVRVLEKSGYVFVEKEYGAEDDPYGNGMLVYKKTG